MNQLTARCRSVGTIPAFASNRTARCSSRLKTTAVSAVSPHINDTKQSEHASVSRMTQVSQLMTSTDEGDDGACMITPVIRSVGINFGY